MIPSWFSKTFTAQDIPDLTGKVAIVTGGNTGLGYETTLALAKHGAHVFMAARSESRAKDALDKIKILYPNAKVEFLKLDLMDIQQCHDAATAFVQKGLSLHILVNNAGIMGCPFQLTKQGLESQFGTNHMGHFAFTMPLVPLLKKSAPSRVVNISSNAHTFAPVNVKFTLEYLNDEKNLSSWNRYGISKLANILFTKKLQETLQDSDVFVTAAHPGVVATEIIRGPIESYGPSLKYVSGVLSKIFAKTPGDGALTQLYCATSPEIQSKNYKGAYFIPTAKLYEPSAAANNTKLQNELWEFSQTFIAEHIKK